MMDAVMRTLLTTLVGCFLSGCMSGLPDALPHIITIAIPQSPYPDNPQIRHVKVGQIDRGKFVIFVYPVSNGWGVPFYLKTDYAVMLMNEGDDKKPIPRFLVAIRKGHQIMDTRDFKVFSEALKRIPRGSKVPLYDKCEVSMRWGLTSAQVAMFDRSIRCAHLKMPKQPIITDVDLG